MSAELRVQRAGRITTVLIDGPEKHNVLSGSGWLEVTRVFRLLGRDEGLDCVVVRGVGGRALHPLVRREPETAPGSRACSS